MKKIMLLLLLITSIGYSQDCKFEKNEFDAFTKSKFIKTQDRNIVDAFAYGKNVSMQFVFNKNPYINIEFGFKGIKKFKVNPENNVSFLLTNDEVITFNIGIEMFPDIDPGLGMGPNTKYKFALQISKDDLIRIKKIGISKIRLENSEEAQDFDVINQKKIDKLNLVLDCFLNEIDK